MSPEEGKLETNEEEEEEEKREEEKVFLSEKGSIYREMRDDFQRPVWFGFYYGVTYVYYKINLFFL